jgi:hypothetical protein
VPKMHRFNLTENAKDSLAHAVTHIKGDSQIAPGDWKRVIVDLAHVVELLLKEKLRRVHPSFVLANVDKYPSADAFTVSAEIAVNRIQKIAGIRLSDRDLNAIETTRRKRNEIEHFEFEVDQGIYKLIVGQILGFILRFTEEHLDLNWRELCVEGGSWDVLLRYGDFYEDLVQAAEAKIEARELSVIPCTFCNNETFDLEQESCLVCTYAEHASECKLCKALFLASSFDCDEPSLCKKCDWEDGYATATCERY